MLKLTIVHPRISEPIVKYINPTDLKEALEKKFNNLNTLFDYRVALTHSILQASEFSFPSYNTPDIKGEQSSQVLKDDFFADCMITVEIVTPSKED